MPVQMTELEEVTMVEVSDRNLEALGITADAGYGYTISDCASWMFYQPLKGVVFNGEVGGIYIWSNCEKGTKETMGCSIITLIES